MTSVGSQVRIAMRDKHYNEHCWIQNAAMKAGLDLIPSFTEKQELTVVDYGCSQGNNSIEALQKAISTLPSGATANIIFEDTPYNDFNSLSRTIDANFPSASTPKGVFVAPSMVPIGFFSQVVPSAHADLGFSWSSLNYLANAPNVALDATASPAEFVAARSKAFAEAGSRDLPKLLKLRAKEIKADGYLVAAIGGQKPEGETTPGNTGFQPIQAAMMKMLATGKLSMAELGETALFPSHERTVEEVEAAISSVSSLWDTEHISTKLIEHPSWAVYQNALSSAGDDHDQKEAAARKYARETIVNLLSSSGWYWSDVLQRHRGQDWDGADAWLDELLEMAVEEMLANEGLRNAKVQIWYNYVRLRRTVTAAD